MACTCSGTLNLLSYMCDECEEKYALQHPEYAAFLQQGEEEDCGCLDCRDCAVCAESPCQYCNVELE